jgi:hypothetical protein
MKNLFGECKSIRDYHYETDENGWPLIKECNKLSFVKYFTLAETLDIFDALYTNKHGLQDSFVNFWDVVSKKFSSNKYVVGFDPINEPFPAGFENDSSILEPGVFDRKLLQPMYARVFERFMRNDPTSIMYFETGQYPDAYLGIVNKAGFTSPPGGKKNSANHIFNDHSYCC